MSAAAVSAAAPDTEGCNVCKHPFDTQHRKHHCKPCGRQVCSECSGTRMSMVDAAAASASGEGATGSSSSAARMHRVCDACANKLRGHPSVRLVNARENRTAKTPPTSLGPTSTSITPSTSGTALGEGVAGENGTSQTTTQSQTTQSSQSSQSTKSVRGPRANRPMAFGIKPTPGRTYVTADSAEDGFTKSGNYKLQDFIIDGERVRGIHGDNQPITPRSLSEDPNAPLPKSTSWLSDVSSASSAGLHSRQGSSCLDGLHGSPLSNNYDTPTSSRLIPRTDTAESARLGGTSGSMAGGMAGSVGSAGSMGSLSSTSTRSGRPKAPPIVPHADVATFTRANFEETDTILGKGASGVVVLARHKPSGSYYAMKKIALNPECHDQLIRREVSAISQLWHNQKGLVRAYNAYLHNKTLHIIQEYMEAGSLADVVADAPNRRLPEYVAAGCAHQLCVALAFLHDRTSGASTLHRDVKPVNILVSKSGSCKLADFGIMGFLDSMGMSTFVGTSQYMAPERILGQRYHSPADVWSLGVTVAEALLGTSPFATTVVLEQMKKITNFTTLQVPPGIEISEDACDFIHKCLQKDPEARWSAAQLLEHPWLKRDDDPLTVLREWVQQRVQARREKRQSELAKAEAEKNKH